MTRGSRSNPRPPARRDTATPQRSDATRNRKRILDAAQTVMAKQGISAPLESIARAAGVGIGTLYRHFPSRNALIEALFAEEFGAYVQAADEGLAHPDPWEGFCHYLWRIGEIQASEGQVREFLVMTVPGADMIDLLHFGLLARLQTLIERAQAQGTLRADVVAEDTAFVAWGNLQVLALTARHNPNAWRRHMALMIDGFRAQTAHPIAQPPLSEQELITAMRQLNDPQAP